MFCDMQIRRADVTDKAVKDLKEEDWVQLRWDRKLLTELAARKWAGFAPEIIQAQPAQHLFWRSCKTTII